MKVFPPGTRVTLTDAYGPMHGRVVVCLCKRHTWQRERQGTECGHAQCGYPASPEACPWPMHIVWDLVGDESHQGMVGMKINDDRVVWSDNGPTKMRPVPERSGEGAIYTPEYLARKEGNARGAEPAEWREILIG